MCFVFFSQNIKDVMFLSSSNGAEPMTIEELSALPKDEIPRYLKLKNLLLLNDNYVATQSEGSNTILDASYPVYSMTQLSSVDSVNIPFIEAQVIVKDKDFSADSLSFMISELNGMYDNESFGEVKSILVQNGVKVSPNAILIVKEKPPSLSSSLLWSFLTGLGGLLIALSFIPQKNSGEEEFVNEGA